MEAVILYCPQCHGRLLAADAGYPDLPPQQLAGEVFYCPSCEMFMEPAPPRPGDPTTLDTIDPGAVPENRGRPIASGTTPGGSQRGDLSDEGASMWRQDPEDSKRNTWSDKS